MKAFKICLKSVIKPRQSPDKLQGLKQQPAGRLHLSAKKPSPGARHMANLGSGKKKILLVPLPNHIFFNLTWKLNALLRVNKKGVPLSQRKSNDQASTRYSKQKMQKYCMLPVRGFCSFMHLILFAGFVRACVFKPYISRQVDKLLVMVLLHT